MIKKYNLIYSFRHDPVKISIYDFISELFSPFLWISVSLLENIIKNPYVIFTFFIGKYAELLIDIITHSLYVSKTLFGFLTEMKNLRDMNWSKSLYWLQNFVYIDCKSFY